LASWPPFLVIYHPDRGTTSADKLSLLASGQAGSRAPAPAGSTLNVDA
jgi:hypothetical protein